MSLMADAPDSHFYPAVGDQAQIRLVQNYGFNLTFFNIAGRKMKINFDGI